MEVEETTTERLLAVRASYSQSSAFTVLLHRFGNSLVDDASHLRVSIHSLAKRIMRAAEIDEIQLRLFDGIWSVDTDFMPPVGRDRLEPVRSAWIGDQSGWVF